MLIGLHDNFINFGYHIFIKSTYNLIHLINLILKMIHLTLKFDDFRDTSMVQIFKIGVFGEPLEMFPDTLAIVNRQIRIA
mgnify:CR=1 FL=1